MKYFFTRVPRAFPVLFGEGTRIIRVYYYFVILYSPLYLLNCDTVHAKFTNEGNRIPYEIIIAETSL